MLYAKGWIPVNETNGFMGGTVVFLDKALCDDAARQAGPVYKSHPCKICLELGVTDSVVDFREHVVRKVIDS